MEEVKNKKNIQAQIKVNTIDKNKLKTERNNKKVELLENKIEQPKNKMDQQEYEADYNNHQLQFIYYQELFYQNLFSQYYVNNKTIEKMKLEFAILQCNSRFKEICQIFVKKIVLDLGSNLLAKPDIFAFSPFVIPVPKSLKNKETASFLYNISGINFQLTWVRL